MCPEDPIRPDRPEGSSEFHETDFYSLFQEQNGTLSEGKPKAPSASDEIDEETIQELMDAALLKKGGDPASSPVKSLDTSVREDWAEAVETTPRPPRVSGLPPLARPARKPARPRRPTVGRGTPASAARKSVRSRTQRPFLKIAGGLAVSASLIWAFYTQPLFPRGGASSGVARAGDLHAAGQFSRAAQIYESLGNRADTPAGAGAKLAFLRGGACEQLWRAGEDPSTNFERALAAYDESVRMDASELRVYAVEAQLAKAEMLVEEAHSSDTVDARKEREGWAVLAALIDAPAFQANPAVRQGAPHRRLAEWMRAENPEAAIDLLKKARESQGDLEEGLENLMIASIYQEVLDDPDRAEEYFELVEQNELASPENRRRAESALVELRDGAAPLEDLLSEDPEEVHHEWDTIPEEAGR